MRENETLFFHQRLYDVIRFYFWKNNLYYSERGGLLLGTFEANGALALAVYIPEQVKTDITYCSFDYKTLIPLNKSLKEVNKKIREIKQCESCPSLKIIGWFHTHPRGTRTIMSQRDYETYLDLIHYEKNLIAVIMEPYSGEITAYKAYLAEEQVEQTLLSRLRSIRERKNIIKIPIVKEDFLISNDVRELLNTLKNTLREKAGHELTYDLLTAIDEIIIPVEPTALTEQELLKQLIIITSNVKKDLDALREYISKELSQLRDEINKLHEKIEELSLKAPETLSSEVDISRNTD
ncbi:MAG: hypothetical protein DRJ63_06180 [Thermoprotei archaeon]|nr:MAG: hypothetical protein DRJ63_06180 [Thermoprotei archaeon]